MSVSISRYEQGPIRPPSEAQSLLIRLTRNCPWNQCLFCPVYKGEKFSRRSFEELQKDIEAISDAVEQVKQISKKLGYGEQINRAVLTKINVDNPGLLQVALWLFGGAKNVFLQDADSLVLPVEKLARIILLLRRTFPSIDRVTTYARAHSINCFSQTDLERLKNSGLSRIHIGLESGNDAVLALMKKGINKANHIEAGKKVKHAGLSLSYYIILGLGGRDLWREHALDTASVINQVNPNYIRVRTLAVHPAAPLYRLKASGGFIPLSDDEIIKEELVLIENLAAVDSFFVSDHILNLLEELEGKLPEAKEKLVKTIQSYLALPDEKRELFRLGRRTGNFRNLADLADKMLCQPVENYYWQLKETGPTVDDHIQQLMLRFI
jgi:radical SAM superfamily enzyme YgiQ (UPF0313 family)